jgi:REP element-mobilizing transposase RayT
MRYSSSAHTRFYHRFHVVWVTKYRYAVLQGPMRERIRQIIRQTCDEMGVHKPMFWRYDQTIHCASSKIGSSHRLILRT